MSPSNKKAFVLVYSKVIPYLEKKDGYETYPTPLFSVGKRDEGPATMQEDVTFIHNVITKLCNDDKEVILAMNSCGGLPGTKASKGLGKVERQKQGLKGGLAALVYVASFFPVVGTNLQDLMGENLPNSIRNGDEYMFMNLDEDYKNIFSNLSKANGKAYIKEFSCHSTVSFTGRLTYPAYKFLPTTYVITEGDKVIPPENQREMLAAAETDGSKITVQSLDAGHVPMVGVPEKVAEVLVSAARQA